MSGANALQLLCITYACWSEMWEERGNCIKPDDVEKKELAEPQNVEHVASTAILTLNGIAAVKAFEMDSNSQSHSRFCETRVI